VGTARERILTVASDLFYREGIRAVGIDRIIADAGVAKASLYANFRSKDDLIVTYLSVLRQVWQAEVDAELAKVDDPADRIRRLFELVADDFDDASFRGCPFTNAAAEYPDRDHPSRRVTDEYRAWLRQRFDDLARAADLEDPPGVAAALVLLYDGACVSAKLDDAESARAATRAAVEQIIDGARPRAHGRQPRRQRPKRATASN
jgi:AcrR family transcriptional regulator